MNVNPEEGMITEAELNPLTRILNEIEKDKTLNLLQT